MAKDPAFLFYYQDFLVGIEFMTDQEVGIYIRLLCHLADKGKLPLEHMLSICGAYGFTTSLQSKFAKDENGLFYNERLSLEVEKRRKYAESRRKNAGAYAKHMENENENENVNVNKKTKEKTKEDIPTVEQVKQYCLERKNNVDPQKWHDFYSAKGWMIGKNKMKDWRAAVRNWEQKTEKPKATQKLPDYINQVPDPKQQEEVRKLIRETLETKK